MPAPKRSPSPPPRAVVPSGATPTPDEAAPRPGAARRTADGKATLRRERERLAGVLHNTLCQELTGISLMASAAARQHRSASPEIERQFQELATLIQRAGTGLREFVRSLQTPDG